MRSKYTPKIRFSGFNSGWEKNRLGDLSEIRRGASPRPIKDPKWFDNESDVGWLRISDVTEQNGLIHHVEQRVSEEGQKKTLVLNEPHLILSIAATVGKPVINYIKTGIHDGFIVFVNPKFNINFMFYWLEAFRPKWRKYGQSGTQVNINSELVKVQDVVLPSLEEQEMISGFLKQLDDMIALSQQELKNLKQTKIGFLQKMFPKYGDFVPEVRFPGFSSDWKRIRLGDRATIKGRLGWKSLKQEEYTSEGPSMIAGRHINNGKIDWNIVDHIPQWRYDESPEIMLKNGDVIFSKDGSLGNPALISGLNTFATINSTMMLVRVNETIDPSFFYQVMNSEEFERLIHLKVSGSSIPHLFQADMNEFTFVAPEKEEQSLIGNFFKQLDRIITIQQNELNILKETRKAFLQKMFI